MDDIHKNKEELLQEISELRRRIASMENEQRRTADVLQKENKTLFTILENYPIGVILIKPDGGFQYVNPEFTRITGYTLQDVPNGREWFNKAYPDPSYRAQVIATWKQDRNAKTDRPIDREFLITCSDGKTLDVDIRSTFMHDITITVLKDITERKLAEKALLESEAKYRNVVEDSLVAFYIIQDDLFKFVNKRFCEIFGYKYEEIVDLLHPGDLTHPDDRKIVEENINKRISGEKAVVEYDFKAEKKDGTIIIVKVIGSIITFNGRPAAAGSIIDITREKELETKLRHAQKMEAIGTLAGGIAHDFNNILTVITGYSTLLQMEIAERDRLRAYADHILSASLKAAQLTRSLLTFSRQQPMVLKPLRINNVIKETEKLLKRLITEDINLEIISDPRDIVIMADNTQIEQILFNLAANARDAMPKGGTLTIKTKDININGEFTEAHGFGRPGNYMLLSVSDTGIGMDMKTQQQIFDPFFTTKEAGKGTGLGLSTVYGIVKEHNGYITVYSEPQMGTTFNIYLPSISVAATEESASVSEIRGGSEKVLIAEDNDSVREIIGNMLRNYGYNVIEAEDGENAVEKFIEHSDIDIIILDSVMPKKNGREAYEEIKKIKTDIKVLFISGHTRDVVLNKGVKDREFHFITKPVMPEEMLQTIREILDHQH